MMTGVLPMTKTMIKAKGLEEQHMKLRDTINVSLRGVKSLMGQREVLTSIIS